MNPVAQDVLAALKAPKQRLKKRAPRKLNWSDCKTDWTAVERWKANTVEHKLLASVPAQWRDSIKHLRNVTEARFDYERTGLWLDSLLSFREKHGDAASWNLSDAEVCERAKQVAQHVAELLAVTEGLDGELKQVTKLDVVRLCCKAMGVAPPKAVEVAGAVARGVDEIWWRRVLRKRVARVVEHGAIKLGIVNKEKGAYCSEQALQRRAQQLARNAAVLDKALLKNEAGQVYRLSELCKASVSNPENRRNELMLRIRGAEEYAQAQGLQGVFLTLTCPSKFHAVKLNKVTRKTFANKKYQGASPRDAQDWLNTMWARVRSEWDRVGIKAFGMRVVEPHHDGTPHWHALLWFTDTDGKPLQGRKHLGVVHRHWLSEDGEEAGAKKNRCSFKMMEQGNAAGYIAKYIAKNIQGQRVDDAALGGHTDEHEGQRYEVETAGAHGAARVDAWASTWGIRQFQAIGMPPVGVWRGLRRVDEEQFHAHRIDGAPEIWRAAAGLHKVGEQSEWGGNIEADFGKFIKTMGGMCRGRKQWVFGVLRRGTPVKNGYGELIPSRIAVGVQHRPTGRCLISRRMDWRKLGKIESVADGISLEGGEFRAAQAATWTGFNNCTARIKGDLWRQAQGLYTNGGSGLQRAGP